MRAGRGRADKTQAHLAEEIGAGVSTVVKYESGKMIPGGDKVWALAETLDTSPNDVLGWPVSAA
ncbi:MAG: helix-turn-helix transcriptional regulator [Eggerthellaceae bacterium]|nr:helix-turn-helix transcriptional regulator [Eggerthellaceae bacterium]